MSFPSQPVEGQASRAYDAAANASVTVCPNCRAEMPGEMRFCRMCGYRLGEGVAEYAETVLLQQPKATQDAPRPSQTARQEGSANGFGQPDAMHGGARGLARQQPGQFFANQSGRELGQSRRTCGGRALRPWLIWPIIGFTLFVATAGGHFVKKAVRPAPVIVVSKEIPPHMPPMPDLPGMHESVLGTEGLEDAEDGRGATFESVVPNSAADRAGLVGGDIIKSFDGVTIESADQLQELLEHTPAGKTVTIGFTRDGETRTTKLQTISEMESDMLEEQSEERPEGQGYIGEGTDLESVGVPSMKIKGIRIGEIEKNNPAYIAGLRNGDIVIEFNGVPTRTRRELESRIERATPGSTANTVIIRDGQRLEIPVKVGQDE